MFYEVQGKYYYIAINKTDFVKNKYINNMNNSISVTLYKKKLILDINNKIFTASIT
jgi:hypothetical protein